MDYQQRFSTLLSRYGCLKWLEHGLPTERLELVERDLGIEIPMSLKTCIQLIGKRIGIVCPGGFAEPDMHAFLLKMKLSFLREMRDRQVSGHTSSENKKDAVEKYKLIQNNKIFVFNRSHSSDLFFYCFLDNEDPAVFLEGSHRVPLFNSFSQLFLFGLQDHFRHILSSDYRSFHKYSKSPIDEKSEKAKLLSIRLAIAEEDGINLDLD